MRAVYIFFAIVICVITKVQAPSTSGAGSSIPKIPRSQTMKTRLRNFEVHNRNRLSSSRGSSSSSVSSIGAESTGRHSLKEVDLRRLTKEGNKAEITSVSLIDASAATTSNGPINPRRNAILHHATMIGIGTGVGVAVSGIDSVSLQRYFSLFYLSGVQHTLFLRIRQ